MNLFARPVRGIKSLRSNDDGQILILSALIVAIVLGMGALAVDVGFFLHERENVQNAVDAGALAGAQLLPNNATNAASVATTFTLANDSGLDSSKVSATFRCLVGDRNHDGQPDASDIPGVCDPKTDASWYVSNGLAISPCVPANGDKCNVIVVSASNNVKHYLAPAIRIKTSGTGSITSAACNGPCGGPPTAPVDVMLVMDRTGSMSSSELANAQTAANSILTMYNPSLQRVGLGLLGPSYAPPSSACAGPNLRAYAKPIGSVPGYTAPAYLANWIPVGLTGTGGPINESYLNADGTLNTGSMLVQAIACYSVRNSSTGTDLATPIRMAAYYLNTYGRPGVRKGIILETDGQPNAGPSGGPNYCAQANTEATTAKTAGIEIFAIGFGLDGSNDVNCPDSTGAFHNQKATYLLASVATQPTADNGCVAAENTDGDHFFCQPKTSDLASVFQTIASTLAAGAHLIALPQ